MSALDIIDVDYMRYFRGINLEKTLVVNKDENTRKVKSSYVFDNLKGSSHSDVEKKKFKVFLDEFDEARD